MVDNRYATALVIGTVLSLLATVYLSVAVGTQHWYQYNSPPGKQEGSNTSEFNNERFDEKIYSDILFRCNGTLGLWWRCIQVPGEPMWFNEPGMTCVHMTVNQCYYHSKDLLRCIYIYIPLLLSAAVYLNAVRITNICFSHTQQLDKGLPIDASCHCRTSQQMLPCFASDPVHWEARCAKLTLCSLCVTLDLKMETRCVSFTLSQQFSPKYKYPRNGNDEEDLLRTCESTFCFITCLNFIVFCFYFLTYTPRC